MNSVSVIMPVKHSGRTIKACLKSLREQTVKTKIIAVAGGSDPETAKAIGLRQAKDELVLLLAADNILPHRRWLEKMIQALKRYPQATAAYPGRYTWRQQDNSLTRYFALLGANDPVAWFMGKADRQSYFVPIKPTRLVQFTRQNMPTLGDNGMLVWRRQLLKAKVDEAYFSHIDVFYDLVSLGLNQFVIVNESIIHDTGGKFWQFLRKRYRYMKNLYLKKLPVRRFQWLARPQDYLRLIGYIIYSVSIIGPLLTALYGYSKKPDLAWFWHIIVCPALALVYALAVIL
jgi:glycosyltransferase involved in cell wall biosynthesis